MKDYMGFVKNNPHLDTVVADGVEHNRGLSITYVRNPGLIIQQILSKEGFTTKHRIDSTPDKIAVVRDVARVMGVSYADVDRIAQIIPPDPQIALNDYMELIKGYISKSERKGQRDIIMGDSVKTNENSLPKITIDTPPFKVFFTWEIAYECNYRCSYCHAPKPWQPETRKTKYPGARKWIEIWERIYEYYGECEIVISGGEPFIYPNFMELMISLSKLHIIEFCTNLFFDVEPIVDNMNPERIRVGTSYHPEFSELEVFIKKINFLKDNGFEAWVNFVPWPPFLPQVEDTKKALQQNGIKIILQPFIGQYEGKQYPQGYTDEEKKLLGIFNDEANIKTVDFKTTNESNKKGKLCRMGQNYAFIHPDGGAERCCKDHTINLGNLIDRTFKLLEEPMPCHADECNCWRCMLVETEPDWVKYWGRPDKK